MTLPVSQLPLAITKRFNRMVHGTKIPAVPSTIMVQHNETSELFTSPQASFSHSFGHARVTQRPLRFYFYRISFCLSEICKQLIIPHPKGYWDKVGRQTFYEMAHIGQSFESNRSSGFRAGGLHTKQLSAHSYKHSAKARLCTEFRPLNNLLNVRRNRQRCCIWLIASASTCFINSNLFLFSQ